MVNIHGNSEEIVAIGANGDGFVLANVFTWVSDIWLELDLSGKLKDWRNNVGFGS